MIEENKTIDILVTNTGGPQKGNFLEVSTEQWKNDYQALWLSVVDSLKVAIPKMTENKYGRVLMITSIAAKEPLAGLTTSNGLRAGLEGLARSMANEFSGDGVTFNLILPGYTNTDRIKALSLSEEKIKQMVPAGRLGEPEELAALACFLASPLAGYITGQSIAIDGGVLKSH
jgi:3-oxoacyl-[acyl-carrier protein] reductase